MAPTVMRIVAQQQTPKQVAPAAPVTRRSALAVALAPVAATLLAIAPAQAAKSSGKELSRSQLLAKQREERREAMKERNAKLRSGEGKPSF